VNKREREEDREERIDLYGVLEASTPTIAVTYEDTTFLVDTADRGVGLSLFVKGSRPEFGVLTQALAVLADLHPKTESERGTFLDIGANIGTSVVPALRTHGFARAVACEPAPANYRLLKANLALNDVADRARALPVAVTDHVGLVELSMHDTNSGGHRLGGDPDNPNRITVDAVTLDLLVERGFFEPEQVTLIWMDTQGQEGHVFRGASTVCKSGVPVVLEFAPALLRGVDGLTPLLDTLAEHYTHFVDLRRGPNGRMLQKTTSLPALVDSLVEKQHTDILVTRLKPAHVRGWEKRLVAAAVAEGD
jgi:FkbM family methyltransferase